MSLIELEDVSYQYRTQSEEMAIEHVDLSIGKGEFVGIVGPADAGKSTLARMIPSYIPNFFGGDFEGHVLVDGVDTREATIGDLSTTVGMLFENPFDQMTGASTSVYEEVAFALENQGYSVPEMIDRVEWSLETVGITDLYNRNPNQLSGGQSQRVALASILALQPDVLVLDEPTSQLDPEGTKKVFEVVGELDRDEFTILLVSQDVERLAPHVDRLVVVEGGRIAHSGDPAAVLSELTDEASTIQVPTQISVGNWLRERRFVDTAKPVPVSYEDVIAEVKAALGTENPHSRTGDEPEDETSDRGDDRSTGQQAISFDSVTYRYSDAVEALSDLSIDFEGGVICVIGQNGAGKTTFAKHLNSLLTPSEGAVHVRGKDTRQHRVAEMAREVGLSFQNPNDQLFHDTVENEIRYGPENVGRSEDEIRAGVEDVIERLELESVRDRNPYDMGQARRKHVAVASVLAMDTPIVVLDEPTGGQDAGGVELLGSIVEELAEEGKLVIVITHDVDFTAQHADRVVALRQGEVLLDGTPEDVFGQPSTLRKTNVSLPTVSQLSLDIGLSQPVLDLPELFDVLERRLADRVAGS